MEKMIQKLIKKIKEHKLFRKFSCLTVACLLLFYMTSVSVFAAEGDEAAAQPQETESITDVWTAVMDGIMDLINAAQGVFWGSTSITSLIIDDSFLAYNAYYPVLNFPSVSVGDSFDVFISDSSGRLGVGSLTIYGSDYVVDDLAFSFSMVAVITYEEEGEVLSLPLFFFDLVPFSGESLPNPSVWLISSSLTYLTFYFSSSSGLTFVGSLAVLGVAIAVIMLLVYVIVSFIRLRG